MYFEGHIQPTGEEEDDSFHLLLGDLEDTIRKQKEIKI
jgi:hypothetical protein